MGKADNDNSFHFKPFKWKQQNPQEHSCQRCANRPIDFAHSNRRTNPELPRLWREGVTEEQIAEALILDKKEGTRRHRNALIVHPKCKRYSWSKAAPFYRTDCENFKEDDEQ